MRFAVSAMPYAASRIGLPLFATTTTPENLPLAASLSSSERMLPKPTLPGPAWHIAMAAAERARNTGPNLIGGRTISPKLPAPAPAAFGHIYLVLQVLCLGT